MSIVFLYFFVVTRKNVFAIMYLIISIKYWRCVVNQKMNESVFLQIRVEKDDRDKFRDLCKKKAVNPSELIRQWIDNYIKQNTDTDNKKDVL